MLKAFGNITWDRFPQRGDPRLPFFLIMVTYVVVGISVLGFNRSPAQVAIIVATTCGLDMLFSLFFRRKVVFPLSAAITGLGLSILANTAHGLWFPVVPAFLAIASKYLITVNGRHIYNPNLFGLFVAVMLGGGIISPSPAYQWGGYPAVSIFVVTAAIVLFATKIQRTALILSFLGFYAVNIAVRAFIIQHHVPWQTIVLGTITSPAFYLFTFFMITDPATSPSSRKGQIFMAGFIATVDLLLHKFEALSTLFKAGFLFYTLMFFYRFYYSVKAKGLQWLPRIRFYMPRLVVIACIGAGGYLFYQYMHAIGRVEHPGFTLVQLPADSLNIDSRPSTIMEETDPRVRHLAKWIMAEGDGVAVADVDNDGDQDFFVSYPLKAVEARCALYLNQGNYTFERFPLPALAEYVENYRQTGLPAGGLWFDYDNDGDKDLYVVTGFGKPQLLRNELAETGVLGFRNVSESENIAEHATSIGANVADFNLDGRLDLFVGNSLKVYLDEYDTPQPLSLFQLPAAQYEGDRRALNFMHRTWHNSNNGGLNRLYLGSDDGFRAQDSAQWGMVDHRWTLDVGVGDLNKDGFPDLYLASDFGPDEMLINDQGKAFRQIKGTLVGEVGRDTYKGMNSTIADLNNDGQLDVYVSNVHKPLQAEGSLLWLNNGKVDTEGPDAFSDRAMAMNALNENRFGWGAEAADLDRDGRLDLLQVNGMVNNNYDRIYEGCPDYWYYNSQVSLSGPDVHGYADAYADIRGRCIFPKDQHRIYLNRGQFFVDVAPVIGWDNDEVARGVATVDFDNDGDLDVMVTHPFAPLAVYRNDAEPKNWLGVKLVGNGTRCNRDAVGTQVTLIVAENSGLPLQFREVVVSNGLMAQSDQRLLFGLADYRGEVGLDINWCGMGQHQRVTLSANQYHEVAQSAADVAIH